MESNNNQSANGTVTIYSDQASPALAFISIVLCVWTIISNLFVFVCLVKHKKDLIKNTLTFQVLTLSVSDFFVGLSTLPIYVTNILTEVLFEFCMVRFVLFFSAQVVAFLHILAICINRLSLLCQINLPVRATQNKGIFVLYLVLGWISTLVIISLPFFFWGKYQHKLLVCSMFEMFQDNYKKMIVYYIPVFSVPTLLTNVAFCAMMLKVRSSSRKVNVVNAPNLNKNKVSGQRNLIQVSSIAGARNNSDQCTEHASKSTKITTSQGPTSGELNKEKSDAAPKNETRWAHAVSVRQGLIAGSQKNDNNVPESATKTGKVSDEKEIQASTSTGTRGNSRFKGDQPPLPSRHEIAMKRTRKALTALGLFLFLYDVCVLPFIIHITIDSQIDYDISRTSKTVVVMLLTVNSAINPFIYTWKFESFRKALGETFRSFRCIKC